MRRSKTASPPPESRGNFTPPRSAASSAEPSGEPAESGGSRFALRNWRVATRLNAILLIPVLVALVFGGFRVQGSLQTLADAQDAERTAELVRAATVYGHALLDERDRSAEPLLDGDTDSEEVEDARKATDEAKDAFHAAADRAPQTDSLNRRLAGFAEEEHKLESLREAAYTSRLDGVKTQLGYLKVQHPLMNLANELGLGTGNITSYGRTVYAVSLSKAAESLTRSIGTQLLVKPGPGADTKEEQVKAFSSYAYLENIALGEAYSAGSREDADRLRSALNAQVDKAKEEVAKAKEEAEAAGEDFVAPPSMEAMTERIASGASPAALEKQGITQETWYQAATGKFDTYRTVERDLTDRAVKEAGEIAAGAKRDAIVNSAIVLAALLVAFLVAGFMARAMSRNMNRLRNAAFDVAEQRLPMMVDQLSRTDPGNVDTQVRPIPIDSRDEIGEVARAFDQVHREAVRLAAEQALLRGNVNAIFTNLSSRNQGLIERQLGLITDLENNEADPDQLEDLFKLDHLATRMRRNGENLLVLAGEDSGRTWNQPVPLVDVLRAASSEVESYERIDISGVPESEIHGGVVTDLVHLLAELLENATSFSSPQTKVKVTATRLPDGRVMIEIHDKGIGLTAEDFADINHKLADPPTVDAAISQRMGLYVVGRLADRHDIRVQLRPSGEQAGTTSLVMLPEAITHGGGAELAEEDFTVSRIVPEQPGATGSHPALNSPRAAAQLGFDENRHGSVEVPDDASGLDPLGRSLFREERRAALEAENGGYRPNSEPERYEGPADGYDAEPAEYDAFTPLSRQEPTDPQSYPTDPGYAQHPYSGYSADQEYAQDQGYGQGGQSYDQGQGYDQGGQSYDQGQGHDQGGRGYDEGHGYAQPQDQGTTQPFDAFGQGGPATRGASLFGEPPYASSHGSLGYAEAGTDAGSPGGYEPGNSYASYDDQGFPQTGFGQAPQEQQPGTNAQLRPEAVPEAPPNGAERVVFDRPGSSAADAHSLTSAGLPRREKRGAQPEEPQAAQDPWEAESPVAAQQESTPEELDWRSANDERWERAEGVRAPKAGGVTTSGLPRRVPRANLVEGAAEQSPRGGPQVSRAPEDVRGRLSNLHRGVRQGRAGGQDANQNDQPGFSTGSTYDQER